MMTGYTSSNFPAAVKDSFDDDDASDDVEDEVFIRDGRNGFKVDDEMGVKRPLMAPRRKYKNLGSENHTKGSRYRMFCAPYCYALIVITAIIGSVIGATLFLDLFPSPLYNFRIWSDSPKFQLAIVPCTDYSAKDIWFKSFPRLTSEAAMVLNDINQDGVDDLVVGFATGIKQSQMPAYCEGFEGAKDVCGGGAVALDGKTGSVIWWYWTREDVLFVDCAANVNADTTRDCLLSGKGGVMSTVDGKTGRLIWELSKTDAAKPIDIYSSQFLSDFDGDGYPEVLIAHTSESSGHIILLSGRDGQNIGQIITPEKELYTAPRVIASRDGTYLVLYATGTDDTQGKLYTTSIYNVAKAKGGQSGSYIWKSDTGISSGILIVDINGDDTEDIVLTNNDMVTVLDGRDFQMLWNVTSPYNILTDLQTQILIGPTPAYFDDDMIPDFLVTQMIGQSFPTYFYSQTWVASGKNGLALLDEPVTGEGEITSPGISISFNGYGNDMYLYWRTTCNVQFTKQMKSFVFAKGSSIKEKAHADLCKLRFNQTLDAQLYALNQHIKPPGFLIYSSKNKWRLEHNSSIKGYHKQLWKDETKTSKYQTYPQENGEERSILDNLRYPNDPVEAREDAANMLPIGINLGELAMDYEPVYPQESDEDFPVQGGAIVKGSFEGRDERAYKRRKTRSATKPSKIPKATITPALTEPLSGSGIDIVYGTHWETASNAKVLTDKDEKCVRKKIQAAKQSNNLNDQEVELVEERAVKECLGVTVEETETETESQLTIYRINFSCTCSNLVPSKESCSSPLPLEKQSYPRRATDVYFKSRN